MILFGFLSRQTILFFVLSALLFVPLYFEARSMNEPCDTYRKTHPIAAKASVPARDGFVAFTPCDWVPETTLTGRVIALCWVLTVLVCLSSFFVDIFWAIRRHTRR